MRGGCTRAGAVLHCARTCCARGLRSAWASRRVPRHPACAGCRQRRGTNHTQMVSCITREAAAWAAAPQQATAAGGVCGASAATASARPRDGSGLQHRTAATAGAGLPQLKSTLTSRSKAHGCATQQGRNHCGWTAGGEARQGRRPEGGGLREPGTQKLAACCTASRHAPCALRALTPPHLMLLCRAAALEARPRRCMATRWASARRPLRRAWHQCTRRRFCRCARAAKW